MPTAVKTRCIDSGGVSDSDPDPYAGDEFRMFEFKVRRCMRGRSHDWTDCPFAHPGEKARRRDPRRFHYSGAACPDFRRGACRRGDACEFAHGVFECWLHPARYRTQPCRDGRSCRRKVCFFAHTPAQLRVLPPAGSPLASPCSCAFCPCKTTPAAASPTSTLVGISHFSPPLSPPSPVLSYRALFEELVSSLDAMKLASPACSVSRDFYEEIDAKDKEEDGGSCLWSNNGCPDLEWVNQLVM